MTFAIKSPLLVVMLPMIWAMAKLGEKIFKGGKARQRDKWFGLEQKDDFPAFRRAWHRDIKPSNGGKDLANRQEAFEAYDDWKMAGAPRRSK